MILIDEIAFHGGLERREINSTLIHTSGIAWNTDRRIYSMGQNSTVFHLVGMYLYCPLMSMYDFSPLRAFWKDEKSSNY